MKKLTLIRHAKSSWKDSDQEDFERPLNKRGKRDAPVMGRRLAAAGFAPDLIASSSAKRATRTAKLIASELDLADERLHFDDALYLASSEQLLAFVRKLDDSLGHVVLIGHNPGLSELCHLLSDAAVEDLPTCGVLHLELPVKRWSEVDKDRARVLGFEYPKKSESSEE